MTDGFDVLVQLVMAAITTAPPARSVAGLTAVAAPASAKAFLTDSSWAPPSPFIRARSSGSSRPPKAPVKLSQTFGRATRSCGRLGPATDGSTDARAESSTELDPDHHWRRQEHRLAEESRLGLDPADAPAEDAEPVDHRGVGVGSDERVGQRQPAAVLLASLHDLRQVLQVDLVADPHAGRHNAEVVERLLRPAQEGIALVVSLVLPHDVLLVGAE